MATTAKPLPASPARRFDAALSAKEVGLEGDVVDLPMMLGSWPDEVLIRSIAAFERCMTSWWSTWGRRRRPRGEAFSTLER